MLIARWVETSSVWLEAKVYWHVPLLLALVLLPFNVELLLIGVKDGKLEVSAEVYVYVKVLLLTFRLTLLLLVA